MSQSKTNKNTNFKKDVISINIDALFTPIAILLSGIIIALSLFIALRGSNNDNGIQSQNEAKDGIADKQVRQAPDKTNASVKIGDDPILGNRETAKIAIVEFSDYECPFCKRYHQQTFDQIVKNYVDTGEAIIVYKDFPLSFHDPLATKEAIAAECVQDLAGDEVYFKYGSLIYKNTNSNGNGLEVSKLYDLAEEVGINREQFTECFDSEKFKDEVQQDIKTGSSVGITGTPGFVIGVIKDNDTVDGVLFTGAQPYSSFETVIKEQLSKAK